MASNKCPLCGKTSRNSHDAENEYCGHCHQFYGDVLRDTERALVLMLQDLELPVILAGEAVPDSARGMMLEGDMISLRRGTMLFGPNGEPIEDEFGRSEGFARIVAIRNEPGSQLSTTERSKLGVLVDVSTCYVGVDLSTRGPLPLVWDTLILVGEELIWIHKPVRYATKAAAYAGHEKVVAAVRRVLSQAPGPPTMEAKNE